MTDGIVNALEVLRFEYHEYNPLRLFAECCMVNWDSLRFDGDKRHDSALRKQNGCFAFN